MNQDLWDLESKLNLKIENLNSNQVQSNDQSDINTVSITMQYHCIMNCIISHVPVNGTFFQKFLPKSVPLTGT